MKRAIIVVLVVALLAGLGYIGFSTKASAAQPQHSGQPTRLVEIFDEVQLDPDDPPASSDWFDASNYRKFKLLVRLTPGPTSDDDPLPNVRVFAADNPNPPEPGPPPHPGGYVNIMMENNQWQRYPRPDFDQHWAMSPEFEGLYSNIRITAHDFQIGDIDEYRISLYLLMATE